MAASRRLSPVLEQTIDLDDFTWADWADHPYPLYRRLRDERPVYWDAPNATYVVTRSADLYDVLGDHARFSNVSLDVLEGRAPRLSPIKEEDPSRHGFLRSLVKPLFTPGAIRRRQDYLRAVCRDLLDDAEAAGDVIDASSALGIRLPGRVTLDLVGLPSADHARFYELVHERHRLLHEKEGRIVKVARPRTIDHVNADMWAMVEPIIEQRRREPREDTISALAAAQREHGTDAVSDQDFLDLLLHLLTGGFETTQHLIELLVDHVADHDETWQRLRDDRTLVGDATEEMLRWDSPVQALTRRATVDTELRGVPIPRDAKITVVYGSANRDERAFDDPDAFRLGRPGPKRHLAFSYGIHYCVGAPLSRAEVAALLNEMLDRYVAVERAGPSEPLREPAPRVTVGKMRGYDRVPVRLHRA